MQHADRRDLGTAAAFVLAAAAEAVVRHLARLDQSLGLVVFEASGGLFLGALALRRIRPVVCLWVLTFGGLAGAIVSPLLWPGASDGGGVWILALMVATYSLGVYGPGRALALAPVLTTAVVLASDLSSTHGWDLVSGVVFAGVFLGALPAAAGRLVRVRRDRLLLLRRQREEILRAQRHELVSVRLEERVRNDERIRPTLLAGLRDLADAAEAASGKDAGVIEEAARDLLARTRAEVVTLTAPVAEPPQDQVPEVDHLVALRSAAQPWLAVAAGAVGVGLALEVTGALRPSTPDWVAVVAGLLVAAPLGLAWWRPVLAASGALLAAATYSRLVAPLDGSLSETGLVLGSVFSVALLSRRRGAVVGLMVCLLVQLAGVGTDDAVGETFFVVLCWAGGLAVHEAGRLVEQTRAYNHLIAAQRSRLAGQAAIAERMRLARDIHDALGHSLTVVALQAGAARRLSALHPERSREVMATVAAAAREGARELTSSEPAQELDGLLGRLRTTDLLVDADTSDLQLLDLAHQAVAYRVVQEALTNALRHAPGARAAVRVRRQAEQVEVVVTNSRASRPGAGVGTGRGLAGMRERVAAAGGEVAWRHREDGGFEVRAVLPAARLAGASP